MRLYSNAALLCNAMGKKVNYSGWQNDRVIRLFKRDLCRYENKNVHVGDRISNVALLQVFIFMSVQNDSVLSRRHCCGQYLSEFNDQNLIFVIERNRREQ